MTGKPMTDLEATKEGLETLRKHGGTPGAIAILEAAITRMEAEALAKGKTPKSIELTDQSSLVDIEQFDGRPTWVLQFQGQHIRYLDKYESMYVNQAIKATIELNKGTT
jgi:hypothetical protein